MLLSTISIEPTILFLFISIAYYNNSSNAIKLFTNKILKPISAETVNLDLLGCPISEIPKMDKVISDIIADGGIEKYKAGLNNEDKDLNITQLIQKYSCPPEVHHVRTCDGYILTLFRIRGKRAPVLLMHGILCSAIDFVTVGPGKALPYLLADLGYDVWLGNSRGSIYSRQHERFSPDSKEFWDFSWDEIGRYDLPALIDYVLSVTGHQHLKYVGHSMGNTIFFVMCSELPEYNNKIDLMVAMSPVAWISHMKSILRLAVPFRDLFKFALTAKGKINFLSKDSVIKELMRLICGTTEFGSFICSNFGFLISGLGYSQLNITNMAVVFSHFPGEASLNQLLHYGQEVESGTFQRFDYGKAKNLAVYGSRKPPKYPVEKITAKVAIIYSLGDWLLDVKDANILVNKLKNVVDYYEVPVKDFCHTDFLWGKDVVKLVYQKVVQLLDKC